ncbi:MAG: Mov34/MPN/PAD-1 family protein [Solirubrobacteraceae bacterium]
MRIAADLLDQVVEHARRDAPDECCGLIGVRDGAASSVHAAENLAHSPFRFEIGGKDLLQAMHLDDGGEAPGAIYHSHTRSEPYPSQTDINFAKEWPGWEWLIVGLAGDEPVVRSYLIENGVVREVEVTVT